MDFRRVLFRYPHRRVRRARDLPAGDARGRRPVSALRYDVRMRLGSFDYDAAFEAAGEVVVLFGHSGAGKSLTLQAVDRTSDRLGNSVSVRVDLGGLRRFKDTKDQSN